MCAEGLFWTTFSKHLFGLEPTNLYVAFTEEVFRQDVSLFLTRESKTNSGGGLYETWRGGGGQQQSTGGPQWFRRLEVNWNLSLKTAPQNHHHHPPPGSTSWICSSFYPTRRLLVRAWTPSCETTESLASGAPLAVPHPVPSSLPRLSPPPPPPFFSCSSSHEKTHFLMSLLNHNAARANRCWSLWHKFTRFIVKQLQIYWWQCTASDTTAGHSSEINLNMKWWRPAQHTLHPPKKR